MTKVIFHKVSSPHDKIAKLLMVAHEAFAKNESLFILVDSEKALQFIDRLLWSTPKSSFLPHGSGELISVGITSIPEDAFHVFNTTKLALLNTTSSITTIYEFEEESPQGEQVFNQKFHTYSKKNFTLIAL